ncbi:DUF1385 domain-containing protein [Oceanotoga teriensis]|uniref:DUF1385 domain-containing protein n=1 Tax=Oceanotoga teriensis TaxID=515440 RepID=UPI0027141EFA|nr:DUF1385 domain-containing protein [Oceanotoga teriensis]MDO7976814.1 DUF1385 domain-containing protein [Oceanotoga teriensis]
MNKPKSVGGQAVIEGVMMKAINTVVAVKKTNGKVAVKRIKDKSWGIIEKIPFIRGFFVLLHAMITGMGALSYSAKMSGEEEEEFTKKDMIFSIILAFIVATFGFGVLPVIIAKPFNIQSEFWFAFFEGIVRGFLVIGYIAAIAKMKDIKRVFEYHGAEHKSVYNYESNKDLKVENARVFTTLHPRCGTSFILITVFASIIVFSISGGLGFNTIWEKIISRIVLLPLVAGVAYEFQRLTAKIIDNPIGKILAYPGLMLQKITTNEPDDEQLKIALISLKFALDESFDGETEVELNHFEEAA